MSLWPHKVWTGQIDLRLLMYHTGHPGCLTAGDAKMSLKDVMLPTQKNVILDNLQLQLQLSRELCWSKFPHDMLEASESPVPAQPIHRAHAGTRKEHTHIFNCKRP